MHVALDFFHVQLEVATCIGDDVVFVEIVFGLNRFSEHNPSHK